VEESCHAGITGPKSQGRFQLTAHSESYRREGQLRYRSHCQTTPQAAQGASDDDRCIANLQHGVDAADYQVTGDILAASRNLVAGQTTADCRIDGSNILGIESLTIPK